jgi:uncharacterized repeat protein (TIGR03803 family)
MECLEQRLGPSITVLASFDGTNGASPNGGLVEDSSGNLFGSTYYGGINGLNGPGEPPSYGTVFEVPAGASSITTLAKFGASTGAQPFGGLIEDASGNLIGTTDTSTIFEVPAAGGAITTLAHIPDVGPNGELIEDSSGNIFGTTSSIPWPYSLVLPFDGYGTVFEMPAGSGSTTTLASFNVTDGAVPAAGVIEDSAGNLFGTTDYGGPFAGMSDNPPGYGTVFELAAGSGTITTLASFNSSNGANPAGRLIEDSSGDLFGTTTSGGAYNDGTAFELPAGRGTIVTLVSFDGINGSAPTGGLYEDSNGNLLGTTSGGGAFGDGTVFEIPAATDSLATLAAFNGSDGSGPTGDLIEDSARHLFGTMAAGGASGDGAVFEISSTSPVPAITTASLLNWIPHEPGYNQTIGASGGTGSYTFSAIASSLPPGLTLSSTGVLSGTPTNQGTYTFPVTVADSFGAGTTQTYSITVAPGPLSQYLVTVVGSSAIRAGSGFLVTVQAQDAYGNRITDYSGPATVTATLRPASLASSFPATIPVNSGGLGFLLANVQTVGSYTISVADSSGTYTGSSSPFTITPGTAAGLAFGAQPVSTPTGVTLPPVTVQVVDTSGNVISSDNSDTVTLGIASGPGSFAPGSVTTATVVNGVATLNNLTLVVPGSYTLSATVPAKYVGPNSSAFTVAALQVVPGSFASSPIGFSVSFNAPFLVNSTTPVLYGQGFGAKAPYPSVTLTQVVDGAGHPIAPVNVLGSVVLDTAANSLTFVDTDTTSMVNNGTPILPDGVYVADIAGMAAHDGFQALNAGGGFLDGTGSGTPGSDFTATFTVGAAAAGDDVVWVPATADGPLQALQAPGNNQQNQPGLLGSGYPVYLDDSTGAVTSVSLTFNYNPALLIVTGVTSNSALPGSSFTLSPSSTPGHAVLQYSGPASSASLLKGGTGTILAAGSDVPLGFINATVVNGTAANPVYRAKDLLTLTDVAINPTAAAPAGSIPSVGASAVHLDAYVGDADGNGSYSSGDAVLITRALLSADTGFTAYPLVDPVIVADTDGDGFIPADAALQVNEAGVGIHPDFIQWPILGPPPGPITTPIANNVDPNISIPSNLQVGANGTVTVPVNIDDAHAAGSTGLIEAHLALTYDPRQFTVLAADVHAGSLLAGGDWSIVPTIDQATGQIGITLSSGTPISSSIGGSLVTIDFHPDGMISSPAPFELVAFVDPKGQYFATELEDAQGTFTLSPAPTNGFDPRIDGVIVLSPTPVGALVSIPGVEAATIVSATAGDVPEVNSRSAKGAAMVESAGASADGAPIAASDREAAAVPNVAVVNVSGFGPVIAITAGSSLASMTAGTPAGLLGAFAVQISGVGPGLQLTAGQRGSDQFFQALGHWISGPAYLSPTNMVSDTFGSALAGQLLPVPPTADSLDYLNWNEVSSDVDWEGIGDPLMWRGRNDPPAHQLLMPASVPQSGADQATLVQCFSQMDAVDLTAEDE